MEHGQFQVNITKVSGTLIQTFTACLTVRILLIRTLQVIDMIS